MHPQCAALPYSVTATTAATLPDGGTPFNNSVAGTSAWQQVLAFLRHLT